MQPHAGNPEGTHFPLRKGTEVQVAFLRADPDQPVITGVVPNAITTSPVVQANRTQNVVQTGGLNRLEIEDKKGSEYIDLSTPPENTFMHLGAHAGLGTHNYVFSTQGDYAMHTGKNRDIVVGGEQTETVKGNVDEKYHATQTTTVDGSLNETIDGGATQTIHAGASETIDGGATETISGGETRSVTGGQKETIAGGRTQSITGSSVETITGALTQTITGGATITTPAAYSVVAASGFDLTTPSSITLIAHGGFNLLAPGGQTRLDEVSDETGGTRKTVTDNQIIFAAKRLDARALYFESAGLKADFFILKQAKGRSSKQTAVVELTNKGVCASMRVFTEFTGALKVFGG
jgi:type VI secretion system secreted protein VgrG